MNRLKVTGGTIDLLIAYGAFPVSDESITKWVETSAEAVSTYFGTFPVRHVRIIVAPADAGCVCEGVTTAQGIRVKIGPDTRQSDLDRDWIMTHEMFHLAFPDLDPRYLWLEEGLASYLEPLARARIGVLAPEKVWRDFVEGMPEGEPQADDQGLDNTHTWGRTYWGGAMFCLVADVRIREQTHNRRSLDDAMRAILAQGGDCTQSWSLERVLDVGDQATGTRVLHELHREMGAKPATVNFKEFWDRLGIEYEAGRISFDDSAPLAQVRKSMTARVAGN